MVGLSIGSDCASPHAEGFQVFIFILIFGAYEIIDVHQEIEEMLPTMRFNC